MGGTSHVKVDGHNVEQYLADVKVINIPIDTHDNLQLVCNLIWVANVKKEFGTQCVSRVVVSNAFCAHTNI